MDTRTRFGWAKTLDNEPQRIAEKKSNGAFPVAVIPLPFMSAKIRAEIRGFTKRLNGD
jgi:hypothetical protein